MTESLTSRVSKATQQIEDAGKVYSEVKCADSNTMVETGCGQVPSLRKVLKDLGGYQYKGTWAANTYYEAKDQVKDTDGVIWLCIENHTSGAEFDADAKVGQWVAYQVIRDTPVFNRRVVEFGVGVAFGPYEEDGRTLLPRLKIGAIEYVAVSDINENLTFTSADVDDRFDGTVSIQTSEGKLIFSKIWAEALTRSNIEGDLRSKITEAGSVDNKLFIFCGDSTTEQAGGNGFGFDYINDLGRQEGNRMASIRGLINFGGSGYQFGNFVSDRIGTIPTIPDDTDHGTGNWDFYGHKPTGAIPLLTAKAWREQQPEDVIWVICFGINDCILNASIGNQTREQISNLISKNIKTAITSILRSYLNDKIILRSPNPMTARPYNPDAGFPSPTEYPDFGSDESADQALVDKWNHALHDAYIGASDKYERVVLWDSWKEVFGKLNTTVPADKQSQLGDLVHPSSDGYNNTMASLINLVAPFYTGNSINRDRADKDAELLGVNPWELYPQYFRDNPKYTLVKDMDRLIAIGSNYIDLAISLDDFNKYMGFQEPLYVSIANSSAQEFSSYNAIAFGVGVRLLGVSPSAAMQASRGQVSIFKNNASATIEDTYLRHEAASGKYREMYYGRTFAAGNGYIDFTFDGVENRPSTAFCESYFNQGSLLVGGGVDAVIDIGDSPTSSVAPRSVRVLKSGDNSHLSNKPAALVYGDEEISPSAYSRKDTLYAYTPIAQNARSVVCSSVPLPKGADIRMCVTVQIPHTITANVYQHTKNRRILIGEITITPNAISGVLDSGNPTVVAAGVAYECQITSATVSTEALFSILLDPK